MRLQLPSKFKSRSNKLQSSGKSLVVLGPEISKPNLRSIFTDTEKTMANINEKNCPKTKFTARDKSQDLRSPSPRLKTFPAEKIKKIDGNTLLQQPIIPQLNYHEPFCAPSPEQNIGYGDALTTSQQIQITPRHQPKNSSTSQQNVPHTYRVGNSNQSEGVLPSQRPEAASGQSRRPFVANMLNGATIQELSPKKQITPRSVVSHMPTVDSTRQSNQEQIDFKMKEHESMKPQQNLKQETPQASFEILEPDYEKQPIGGRVAALHRQRISEQKQVLQKPILQSQMVQEQTPQQIQQNQMQHYQTQHQMQTLPQQQIPQEQIQHLFHNLHPVSHDRVLVGAKPARTSQSVRQQIQSSPQQVYQQLQKNAAHQQYMQQEAMAHQEQIMMNQMQHRAYYDYYYQQHQQKNEESTSPKMTSPHDQAIHREINHNVHHMAADNQGHHKNSILSSKDNSGARTQLNPFAIDLVTSHPKQPQSHVHTSQCQQSLQTNHATHNTPNNSQTNQNTSQPNHSLQNNSNDHQIRVRSHQQVEAVDTQRKQSEGKKVYYFTPQMIKDQEQLIATMQQQSIPEDVMQRQFRLLLNEQKKQLAYLELVAQSVDGTIKSPTHRVSKKITKTEIDEKPEWMAHITPPRIPYSDLEKVKTCSLRTQQNNKDCVQEEHRNQIQTDQRQYHQHQSQHQQEQFQHNPQQATHQQQFAHQQYQVQLQQQKNHNQIPMQQEHVKLQDNLMQPQQNSCQTCQYLMTEEQSRSGQPTFSNFYHPYERTPIISTSSLNNDSPHLQHQHLQYNYSNQYYQQPHPQFQEQHFQNWQQSPNRTTNTKPELKNVKNVEPSSLLQLRLYKEVIQPQKRNNGLQDPETVRESLQALKSGETQKGLEYLANLNKKETVIRLNGTQESGEIPANILQRTPESFQEMSKQVSANGLENKRNHNNPLPPPVVKIRHLEDRNFEFPRTKNSYRLPNYTQVAERENGSVAPVLHSHQHPQVDYAYNQISPVNLSISQNSRNSQQLKQFYMNRQTASDAQGDTVVPELREISGNEYTNQPGGDQQTKNCLQQHGGMIMGSTDIQEPIIIGGITYLARKPNYIHNVQVTAGSCSANDPSMPNMS